MDLQKIFHIDSIELGADLADKSSVLEKVADLALKNPIMKKQDRARLVTALKEREDLASTGFTGGIAIPHCVLSGLEDFVLGMISVPGGLDFKSLDGSPTRFFVFIIAPQDNRKLHIKLLADIARVLKSKDNVEKISSARTAEEVRGAFLSSLEMYGGMSSPQGSESTFLRVFVQVEERFNEVLELLSETEGCQIMVLEGNAASRYFNAMPLLASFWTPAEDTFNRLIFATVPKKLTNSILGKLESIIETLENKTGLLVIMNEISYISGGIEL